MSIVDVFFNPNVLARAFPMLFRGLWNTILLGLTAIVAGTLLGIAVSLVRLYALKPFRLAAVVYTDLLRAMPVLVVLILIYYALPFVGIVLSSFTAAGLALSMVMGAYSAEVVRAGIQAVPKGQFEAASALGLGFWLTMRKIVMPQALRIVIPPHASNCVSVIKDTSLASVVAMSDLLKQATDAQALFANPSPLIGAAIVYVAILWPLVRLTGWLEHRFNRAQTAR
jgi:polar amino acid transport system permease protein